MAKRSITAAARLETHGYTNLLNPMKSFYICHVLQYTDGHLIYPGQYQGKGWPKIKKSAATICIKKAIHFHRLNRTQCLPEIVARMSLLKSHFTRKLFKPVRSENIHLFFKIGLYIPEVALGFCLSSPDVECACCLQSILSQMSPQSAVLISSHPSLFRAPPHNSLFLSLCNYTWYDSLSLCFPLSLILWFP